MGNAQRLDKFLSRLGYGSRTEVKRMVKDGRVAVGGTIAADSGMRIDPQRDTVTLDGVVVKYREFIYLMMNKPAGVISATEDRRERTVLDLIDPEYAVFKPFPVGRLDKDTEGLLLLTNDGKLAHRLLSPKKKVPKTYYAEVEGSVTEEDGEAFARGVTLDDGYVTLPANLVILQSGPYSRVELTIVEGKFHQVKRMFAARGKRVIFLKRIAMGPLKLDPNLPPGAVRELTEEELRLLPNASAKSGAG